MKEPNNRPPQEQGEEVAHYDDAVIGRAFRLSAVAAVAVLLIAGVTIYLVKKKPAAAPAKVTEISAPVVAQRTAAQEIPVTPFREITSEAGISFVHNSGAIGEKLLPETMGGGVTVIDFNHDGAQDLLFINGNYWPGKAPPGKQPTTSVLYQNDGRGKFSDVTSGSGLDLPIYGMGAAVGDFDNDGNNDLFFTAVGGNKLFRNLGNGKFHDVTAAAKVGGTTNDWSTAAAFIDIDNDGDLDLFVGNYVRWSREIDFEVGYKLVGVGRAYGQPNNFEGAHPYLYRNDGNGTFTDISAESGVQVKNVLGGPSAKTLGVAPIDVDQDGWIDLIVANDTVPNGFFHNQKNGTFKEIGGISGVAFDNYGATRGAMGIDAGYFRNDRSLGIVIGNFANEMTALYVLQDQPLTFTDEAITEGIGPASRLLLKFGIFFFDYDLDGRLDVLSCNGHLEEEISKVQKSQNYKQPSQLFWNAGDSSPASFIPVSTNHVGLDLFKPIVGRGSAYADFDQDGDLDVVLCQTGGAPLFCRNDQSLQHNWLKVQLTGKKSNRSAIGATINLKSAGQLQSRQVMPTRSYLSQCELPVTFGLGKATSVDELVIRWPSGKIQPVTVPSLNRSIHVTEAD